MPEIRIALCARLSGERAGPVATWARSAPARGTARADRRRPVGRFGGRVRRREPQRLDAAAPGPGAAARRRGRGRPARVRPDVRPGLGLDRLSLREVSRRLAEAGVGTSTGKARWDPTTIAPMLRSTAHVGRAVLRRSRHVQAPPRLRPLRRHPQPARKPSFRVPVPRAEWIEIPVPALVAPTVFEAAQAQTGENRRRRRERLAPPRLVAARGGLPAVRPRLLWRGRAGGQRPADCGTYRRTGTGARRFAGQAVCDNRSARSDRLERAAWDETRVVLEAPERVAEEQRRRLAQAQKAQRCEGGRRPRPPDRRPAPRRRAAHRRLRPAGPIERGGFEPRVEGMRRRLSHSEKERQTMAANAEAERELTLLVGRLEAFARKVHSGLGTLDWEGTHEIVRTMVRRVEIDGDHVDVVFRVPPPPQPASGKFVEAVAVRPAGALMPEATGEWAVAHRTMQLEGMAELNAPQPQKGSALQITPAAV